MLTGHTVPNRLRPHLNRGPRPRREDAMNSLSGLSPGSAGEAPIHDQLLALVHPELLPRECLAEVLQAAFSRTLVVSAAEVGEINPAMSVPVSLGLLKVLSPYAPGTVSTSSRPLNSICRARPLSSWAAAARTSPEAIKAGARGVLPVTAPLGLRWRQFASYWPAGSTIHPASRPRSSPPPTPSRRATLVATSAALNTWLGCRPESAHRTGRNNR